MPHTSRPSGCLLSTSIRLSLEDIEKIADELDIDWSLVDSFTHQLDRALEYTGSAGDLQALAGHWALADALADLDPSHDKTSHVSDRRRHLRMILAGARSRRAGDLADVAWGEQRPYAIAAHRKTHHLALRMVAAYDAACMSVAKRLRQVAKAITGPAPTPSSKPPPQPKRPFSVTTDHLEARLLDIFRVRAIATAPSDTRVEATWAQPVDVTRLRGELSFILAPARVTVADPCHVVLEWDAGVLR